MNQATIAKKTSVTGRGLHKGGEAKVTFKPAAPGAGIIIKNNGMEYGLDVRYVVETNRGTVIKNGKSVLHTIEHMLSAVKALGIDNIEISVDGNEPPVLDGSACGFTAALKKAGIKKQKAEKKQFRLKEPVLISDRGRYIAALPGKGLKAGYFSDFSKHGIAPEEAWITLSTASYIREISRARTFGFKSEIEWLIKAGLIKGASFKNAVLIDRGRPVKGSLRYKNELTRHKLLDLIGDLSFIEGGLNMTVIAYKTGHKQNIELVRKLINNSVSGI